MTFWIQASDPSPTGHYDPEEDDLTCAIDDAFFCPTEHAVMRWGYIFIPIDYGELARMSVNLIWMLKELTCGEGECELHWFSNELRAKWDLVWRSSQLTVAADWEEVPGNLASILAAQDFKLSIGLEDFFAEWKMPLAKIIAALRNAGYAKGQIPELDQLEEIFQKIPKFGRLYRLPEA